MSEAKHSPAAPVPASIREALQTTSEGKYWTSQYNACWDHSKAESLRSASQKALNYIENTEGELGITLSCGDALRGVLASLPAPAAAPTREEPTAEAIREILRAHIFASRHYEIRGLDEAANAILALKAAPAK